jgi:type IVB pilus formation R64 PilN family outer membrane protein
MKVQAGIWWKFSDGRLMFYQTETKTFYLPAIARKSTGTSTITTVAGAGGASSAPGGATGGSTTTSSGGATSNSDYSVDVWGDLEKTAKIVGGNAQVIANPSIGSLTVTGTPTQVRNVEEWAKNLSDNLSQQVSITVHIYKIKMTNADNYNWNPSVVFSSLSAGVNFTGPQITAPLSGVAPFNIAANVLNTATGNAAKYTGSQLALQALSTIGHVTETMQQTVVTLNGQPAPIQVANQLSYLASTTPGASSTNGVAVAPTLTPGVITTGFTGMFLPRIVNGKILLAMNLSSSTLVSLGSVSSGESNIQTPNVDISMFPQNVMLTPGDSLLLTGLQLDNGKSNNTGVGSASNFLFGGGVDSNIGKQLIAIVITAKVL